MRKSYGVAFVLLICIAVACSKKSFYLHPDWAGKSIISTFDGVPVMPADLAGKLTTRLAEPDLSDSRKKMGIAICQVLVDEEGEVRAVYFNQPLAPDIDAAIIKAVLTSDFLPLRAISDSSEHYAILLYYYFGKSGAVGPVGVGMKTKMVDSEPLYNPVKRVVPDYPLQVLRAELTGEVVVRIRVNAAGEVVEAHTVQTNNELLNSPAEEAAIQFEFEAGLVPVDGELWLTIPFLFKIKQD